MLKGRYRVEALIGRGGMSLVYGATDLLFGRRCVVKVALGESCRARIEREAFIGANLRGDGLVEVYDRGCLPDGETAFVVFERLQGETLGQRLGRGGLLSWQEAFHIAREAAVPLAIAHEAGVVHRDVKPENLFLCVSGEVRLLDFGIARVAGDPPLTGPGELPGTPRYMAYEQVAMPHAVDHRADIYALGLLLRAAVAGDIALPQPGVLEPLAFARVLRQQLDLRVLAPWLPHSVALVIEQACHRERERRYQTMREFRRALEIELRRQGGIVEFQVPPPQHPLLNLKGALGQRIAIGLLVCLGVAGLQMLRGPRGGSAIVSPVWDPAASSIAPPAKRLPPRPAPCAPGTMPQGQGQGQGGREQGQGGKKVPAARVHGQGSRALHNELMGFGGDPL
ncbi:MAG TPA: serine/threonine-protein kinase [Polyangia bacterium]|nr:serine/threonine-protein kinase [Polyangia bacterium]